MSKEKSIEKILFLEVPRTNKYNMGDLDKVIKKFNEESDEIREAIEMYEFNKNEENYNHIAEELFDGIQMCVKLLEYYNIDIRKANRKHIEKLKGRGICL